MTVGGLGSDYWATLGGQGVSVKVSLLVPGMGNEVAGLHAGLDGRGGLLQAATPFWALP